MQDIIYAILGLLGLGGAGALWGWVSYRLRVAEQRGYAQAQAAQAAEAARLRKERDARVRAALAAAQAKRDAALQAEGAARAAAEGEAANTVRVVQAGGGDAEVRELIEGALGPDALPRKPGA